MIRKLTVALLATAATATACVTINVYFPAAAIKDLSRKIEEEVRKKAAAQQEVAPATEVEPAAPEPPPPGQQSPPPPASESGAALPPGALSSLLGVTPALADDVPAPEISNPAIRRIIESRAGRVAQINAWKAKGAIGENNQSLLEARSLETLKDLKDRAEVQRLVKAENADREELFREIAAAKNVPLSDLPKIRETYAATLREDAHPGDWIQGADGTWKQK